MFDIIPMMQYNKLKEVESMYINLKQVADRRYKSKENLLLTIAIQKKELDTKRPLYNSNAIERNTLTLKETDLILRSLTIDKNH